MKIQVENGFSYQMVSNSIKYRMPYVPPHLRNQQPKERHPPRRQYDKPHWQIEKEKAEAEAEEKRKEAERGLERTEENFPALGSSDIRPLGWVKDSGRKFTQLVSEWKEEEDKRKEEEEFENRRSESNTYAFTLPKFHTMGRFGEPEDEIEDDQVEQQLVVNPQTEDDGWVLVEKKFRKPKSEKTFEEFEKDMEKIDDQEDDTVWGAPEEHETCWDERRH
jgi:hypothetical protein